MKTLFYKIADTGIKISIPFYIEIQNESIPFIAEEETTCDTEIIFEAVDQYRQSDLPLLYEGDVRVYGNNELMYTEYHIAGKVGYAWMEYRKEEKRRKCCFLRGWEKQFCYSRQILSMIMLEQILLEKNTFILHASFIRWKKQGILFTAPSQTGKSTQANLWEKYEQAEIVNGDRAAICQKENQWCAYGLPLAGSSQIYKNESAPIRMIVVLRKSEENHLYELKPSEAFKWIYNETTIYRWDNEFVNRSIDIILKLVSSVHVYMLECRPEKSSVDILKSKLEELDTI